MRKSWITRLAIAGTAGLALVGMTAAPAMAGDKTYKTDRGYFKFIDDGDMFKICDTKKDGHGVKGYLYLKDGMTGKVRKVMTIDDGGDKGCDKKGFNIGNFHQYRMVFIWNGNGGEYQAVSPWFNE
ncbi:hypothetical protein [Salininema proteolyticum]|uniref:Uncharacterized protein n=1 Tax=Salininema proteolyticum TaxID=1607685 RepID=A0ABV8TZX8_9ACTN